MYERILATKDVELRIQDTGCQVYNIRYEIARYYNIKKKFRQIMFIKLAHM